MAEEKRGRGRPKKVKDEPVMELNEKTKQITMTQKDESKIVQ